MKAGMLYVSGKVAESRTRAQQLIGQYGANVNPRMYKLVAFASDSLGDYTAAREAMANFLAKADSTIILATDYEEYGKIYGRLQDSATRIMAFQYYGRAIAMDTLDADKAKFAGEALELAKQVHDKQAAAYISGADITLEKSQYPGPVLNMVWPIIPQENQKRPIVFFVVIYESKYPRSVRIPLVCKSKQAVTTA